MRVRVLVFAILCALATPRAHAEDLVPASARFVTIKLTDLTNNEILLDAALDPSGSPKLDAPNAKSISALATALRSIRAKSFPQDGFTEKVFLGSEERPWRYRLDVALVLPGGAGEKTSENVLFFTDRFGGTQQFAGSAALNTVFELEQPFVDALWTLTYGPRDPGPIAAPVPAKK